MPLLVRDDDELLTVTDADLMRGRGAGDPDTVYTYRPLPEKKRKEIVSRYRKPQANPRTHRMEVPSDDTPEGMQQAEAASFALLDYVLVDWSGILYKKTRQPVPCTEETKRVAIDSGRQAALLQLAEVNEVAAAEVRAESFREPS